MTFFELTLLPKVRFFKGFSDDFLRGLLINA